MKSGTWLMREIVTQLTGLRAYEPDIPAGRPRYDDAESLIFPPGSFFSWHLLPTGAAGERLRQSGAKSIFLVRNIYDTLLSIHRHLLHDVDAEIGRATGQAGFLSQFSRDQALTLVINGYREVPYDWHGMGPILFHLQELLTYSLSNDVLLTSFERLTQNKAVEVEKIAAYLGVESTASSIEAICAATSLGNMREAAKQSSQGQAHFQIGSVGAHDLELTGFHKVLLRGVMQNNAPQLPALVVKTDFKEILKGSHSPYALAEGTMP
jgi:hypothetical protein